MVRNLGKIAWMHRATYRAASAGRDLPFGLTPHLAGVLCCAMSATSYTLASICMRRLSALHCDEMWATCNKELVTVVVVGPWLLWEAFRGRSVLPRWPTIVLLVLVGLAVQWCGNLPSQWAYGVVGLAVVISANEGAMLTSAAAMGRVFLGERVSRRSIGAVALLLCSLGLLALGAEGAGKTVSADATAGKIALALGGACIAGVVFASLSTAVRHAVTNSTRMSFVMVTITGMGALTLGPVSFARLGVENLLQTPSEQIAWMAAAGTFNLIGFLGLVKALHLIPVVHANVFNASQVAMASVSGVLFFHESANVWLILGVCATISGVVLIDRPVDAVETA
jgi:drug/metabolite transporter, DME family